MGTKSKIYFLKSIIFLAGILGFQFISLSAELIELNRVVAKVNERVVTWAKLKTRWHCLISQIVKKMIEPMNSLMEKLIDCFL